MWKSSIRGIILNQIQFSFSNETNAEAERIYYEVFTILNDIAWFHRIPVQILAATTTIFCVIRYGTYLDDLDQVKRQHFIENASNFPLWSLLEKLICSITLLHYFDDDPILGATELGNLRS